MSGGAPTSTKQLFLRVKKRERSQLAQRNPDDGEVTFASDDEREAKRSRHENPEGSTSEDVIVLNCPDVGGSEGSHLLFRRVEFTSKSARNSKEEGNQEETKRKEASEFGSSRKKSVHPAVKRAVVSSLAEKSSKTAATAVGANTTQARNTRALVKQRAQLRCERITKSRKGLVIHAEEEDGGGEDADGEREGEEGDYVMYVADIPTARFDPTAAAFSELPTTSLDDIDVFERHLALGSVDDYCTNHDDTNSLLEQVQWAAKHAPYELVGVPGVESWVALHNSITHQADFEDWNGEGDSEDFDLGGDHYVLDHATAVGDEYRDLEQRREEIARGAEDDYDSNSSANASMHEFNGIDDDEKLGRDRKPKKNEFDSDDGECFGEGDGLDTEDEAYMYDEVDSDDDLEEDGWKVNVAKKKKKPNNKEKFAGGGVGFSSDDEDDGLYDEDDDEYNVYLDDCMMRKESRPVGNFNAMVGANRGADLSAAKQQQWAEASRWGQPSSSQQREGEEADDAPSQHQQLGRGPRIAAGGGGGLTQEQLAYPTYNDPSRDNSTLNQYAADMEGDDMIKQYF